MRFLISLIVTLGLAGHAVAEKTEATDRFWAECADQIADPPADGFYRARHFSDQQAMSVRIIDLIRAGEKVGTFTSPWLFEGDRNKTPVVGGYMMVTDFEGTPALIVRTTKLETVPYDEITEEHTQIDGPAVRPLDVWDRVHWAYFERNLEPKGMAPERDMPVVVEQFELVCDAAAL